MRPSREKIIWFVGLTFLLIFCVIIFPILATRLTGRYVSFAEGFGVLVLIIVVITFVILIKSSLQKGNISAHNIDSYTLLWQDKWYNTSEEEGNNRTRLGIKVSLVLVPVFVIVLFFWRSWFYSIPLLLASSIISFLGLSVVSMIFMSILSYFALKAKSPLLRVFNEGILYRNYFLEWNLIKSISEPLAFKVADTLNKIKAPVRMLELQTITVRIESEEGVFLAEVLDLAGFKKAVGKAGFSKLLKK